MPDKYGESELESKLLCPRCVCAVPVFLRTIKDRFSVNIEVHCLKCRHHKNAETYIGSLVEGEVVYD